MGWQQYSRPLWLSIGNPYILYLKAMTDRMRDLRTDFPQGSEFTCFHRLMCLSATFSGTSETPVFFLGGGVGGVATFCGWDCYGWLPGGGPTFIGGTHGDVDVFKDQAWRDAACAIGRFHQIVAGLTAMLATEGIDEDERLSELAGFD